MSITHPSSLEDMRLYIRTRLGHPVINVEIAQDQLDIAIYDTIQEMQRYLYGEGVDLVNTTLIVMEGVSEYYTGDCGIEAAFDFSLGNGGMGGINTMFTPMNMLLYNEWVTNGNYPGGGGYSLDGGGLILTGFEIMGEYMQQMNQMFGAMYIVKYNSASQKLIITPTPKQCGIATLKLYKHADAEKLYNHPLVKRLVVAKAKIQWGLQLGKYTITMPDGSTMNGFEIMNKGYEEEEKWFDELRKQSEPPDFFVD